jgi:hypothetical protein
MSTPGSVCSIVKSENKTGKLRSTKSVPTGLFNSIRNADDDYVVDGPQEMELIRGDRRADKRYALDLDLRFSYECQGVVHQYTGRTRDLSRSGILFVTEHPPAPGTHLELRIAWPFLLQNVCPLELMVWGPVNRSDENGTVVSVRSYEFRTCGERSFEPTSGVRATCNIVA